VGLLPIPVILDTNFLTVPVEFGIDIFSEIEKLLERKAEFLVLKSVQQEVAMNVSETGGANAQKFRVAQDLINRCTLTDTPDTLLPLPVDHQLIEYTLAINGVLATNDRELRKRARKSGISIIFMRGKKTLAYEGRST
jgi:rRNA-processing protein FCF1